MRRRFCCQFSIFPQDVRIFDESRLMGLFWLDFAVSFHLSSGCLQHLDELCLMGHFFARPIGWHMRRSKRIPTTERMEQCWHHHGYAVYSGCRTPDGVCVNDAWTSC